MGTLENLLAVYLCPMISMNASVCEGGSVTLGIALLQVVSSAILDPVKFCTNTMFMCN